MENIEIVVLQPSQWQEYRDLRLKALKEEPQAYVAKYEENVILPDDFWIKRLEEASAEQTQWLLFAKQGNNLVGIVGGFIKEEKNTVLIISLYVTKEMRGQGVAKKLMSQLITKIKLNKLINKLEVGVNPEQTGALHLYRSLGFKIVKQGKEILGDGKEHESYDMELLLNEA